MQPFNMIKAEEGCHLIADGYNDEKWRYVGYLSSGDIILENIIQGKYDRFNPNRVWMAPQKRTVFVNLYMKGTAEWFYDRETAIESMHICVEIPIAVAIEFNIEI